MLSQATRLDTLIKFSSSSSSSLKFGSTQMDKARPLGQTSNITRRTKLIHECLDIEAKIYIIIQIFNLFIKLDSSKRSTFVPQSIFTRSIRLNQTNRTCWSIQFSKLSRTNPIESNVAQFSSFHPLKRYAVFVLWVGETHTFMAQVYLVQKSILRCLRVT